MDVNNYLEEYFNKKEEIGLVIASIDEKLEKFRNENYPLIKFCENMFLFDSQEDMRLHKPGLNGWVKQYEQTDISKSQREGFRQSYTVYNPETKEELYKAYMTPKMGPIKHSIDAVYVNGTLIGTGIGVIKNIYEEIDKQYRMIENEKIAAEKELYETRKMAYELQKYAPAAIKREMQLEIIMNNFKNSLRLNASEDNYNRDVIMKWMLDIKDFLDENFIEDEKNFAETSDVLSFIPKSPWDKAMNELQKQSEIYMYEAEGNRHELTHKTYEELGIVGKGFEIPDITSDMEILAEEESKRIYAIQAECSVLEKEEHKIELASNSTRLSIADVNNTVEKYKNLEKYIDIYTNSDAKNYENAGIRTDAVILDLGEKTAIVVKGSQIEDSNTLYAVIGKDKKLEGVYKGRLDETCKIATTREEIRTICQAFEKERDKLKSQLQTTEEKCKTYQSEYRNKKNEEVKIKNDIGVFI